MDDDYTSLLQRTRAPQPSLQRFAIIQIFQKLTPPPSSSSPPSPSISDPAREAITQCLQSSSIAVVDQSVRELCRLVKDSNFDIHFALLHLQSALEGCNPRFVNVFVKGIGFLVRFGFRAKRFDSSSGFVDSPENHPFVKVLTCRSEVHNELVQQIVLFVVHSRQCGLGEVCDYLRPLLTFSAVRACSSDSSLSSFLSLLIYSLMSICSSLLHEANPLLEMLIGCLRSFNLRGAEDLGKVVIFAEFLVNAYIIVLQHSVKMGSMVNEVQLIGVKLLDALLTLCLEFEKHYIGSKPILELSRRLLVFQKELELHYTPQFFYPMLSMVVLLGQLEVEDEKLCVLDILEFFIRWRIEDENFVAGVAFAQSEVSLFIFPIISLMSSPSKAVKRAASQFLSMLEKLFIVDSSTSSDELSVQGGFLFVSKPEMIIFRLLQHLWLEDLSPCYFFLNINYVSKNDNILKSGAQSWISQLGKYALSVAEILKSFDSTSLSQGVMSTEIPFLLGAIVGSLVMHPSLGGYAIETLAALSKMEPKLGVAFLLAVLYYCNLLKSNIKCCNNFLLKLLGMLSALASNSAMLPLVYQTMLPMLQRKSNPVLFATALRLLCKAWEMNDRVFGSLRNFLLPECFAEFKFDQTIAISLAATLRDICRRNPERGVQLILSVAACFESSISGVRALGFQSLSYLCEADVVDFYTAWNIVAKHGEDYSTDPVIAYSLCALLKWGALDAEASVEASLTILRILWNIGSSNWSSGNPLWRKARITAFEALNNFEVLQVERSIPDFRDKATNLLIHETDTHILWLIEELETKIIAFEHSTRQRFVKTSRAPRSKIEKLLDVFPQVMFSSEKNYTMRMMPGAALFHLQFDKKGVNKGKSNIGDDVFVEYHNMLKDIAASINLSRNIVISLLSLQSWKTMMRNWLNDYVSVLDVNAPSTMLDKTSKAAKSILKCMIKVAEDSIPRVAENIVLALGAFCTILPVSAHPVKVMASEFLLSWLFQHGHEHRQWSAAIAVGVISSCLHSTDRQQKLLSVNGLLEVARDSKNILVKGACGIGLGYSCQDLLTRSVSASAAMDEGSFIKQEEALLGKVVRTLSFTIMQLTKIPSDYLRSLSEYKVPGLEDDLRMPSTLVLNSYDDEEDDIWGVTGLILGLGMTVSALSRAGSYDAICNIKFVLTSWITQADSLLSDSTSGCQSSNIMLSTGACLALPSVATICRRVDMMHDNELNDLLLSYEGLISKLQLQKTPNIFHFKLLLASCVGAGSLLAFILDEGLVSLDVQRVQNLLGLFKNIYSGAYPHIVHLGAFLGVVHAMGADTGITFCSPKRVSVTLSERKELSHINAPLLSSSLFEENLLLLIQDIFLVAKDSSDIQLQAYASWAIAFLHYHIWSNEAKGERASSMSSGHSFSKDSTILKLSSWLMQLDYSKNPSNVNTVAAVLRCLASAPRLPQHDWGAVVRRCIRYEDQYDKFLPLDTSYEKRSLLKECLVFSLAHANTFDQLLSLLDELTSLSRFRTLDVVAQSCLLFYLSDLARIFSSSKTQILLEDISEFLSSPVSPYQKYEARKKRLFQLSCWKGIAKCFNEASLDSSNYLSGIEKCMEILFALLPTKQERIPCLEWNESMLCLGKARRAWLLNLLQTLAVEPASSDEHFGVTHKKMLVISQLVKQGSLPLTELAELKPCMLDSQSQGLWRLFVEVVAVLQDAEGSIKRQWFIDILEISCITKYPSTALLFLGLLSGCFCKYMPFLILDPQAVLVDLPVTLPSLLSNTHWRVVADVGVSHLWTLTLRIYKWAKAVKCGADSPGSDIDPTEAGMSELLVQVLLNVCRNLKEFLPLKNQLMLANMALLT